MKVLLTGANGFVGSHILDVLLARDLSTVLLLRPTADRRWIRDKLDRVQVQPGSLNDPAALELALKDVTHVVHCAGCTKAIDPADFFAVNLNRLEFAGMHDPVAAVVFGQPVRVDYTVVGGKFIVKQGQLVTKAEAQLIEEHERAARRLLST